MRQEAMNSEFKRVLLVFPTFESDTGSSRPSPSIAYIAQRLDDYGIEFDILDMMLGYRFDDLDRKISEWKPDLVGFTMFTLHHRSVYSLIGMVKTKYPGIAIVVGGAHLSIAQEKVLDECSSIDFGCIGEGEDLIIELISGKKLSEIKGLVYRENGKTVVNQLRPFCPELGKIKFPRLRGFELKKYANEILVVSSRGCPYQCIYCSVALTSGRKLRLRKISDVVDEVEFWYHNGKRIFNFVDDNFTFHEDRVYEFCDAIKSRKMKKLILRASNGVRADRLNYALLKRMKEIGFRSIGIGVESASNKVLKSLKKGENIAQIEKAISYACDLGYEVALFFVFGTPGETIDDVQASMDFALKYPVFKVDFYNLIPFPGTELYEWVEKRGAWVGDPEELLDGYDKNLRFGSSPFFETDELPLDTQIKLRKDLLTVMRKVERRYLTASLKKTFGPFSIPVALLASTSLIQNLYFKNNSFRRIAERIRYSILK